MSDTISRTVLTSLTTFLAVLAIWVFGGGIIQNFAFAMLVGIVVGTYSSICTPAPSSSSWTATSGPSGRHRLKSLARWGFRSGAGIHHGTMLYADAHIPATPLALSAAPWARCSAAEAGRRGIAPPGSRRSMAAGRPRRGAGSPRGR
ncbi:MAG: hypothetical protein R3F43_12750 [bacterium]